ncbi:tripartite tricarboxylate transporter permease [Martelella mediterranea]|uniref:tripartite tricarboxylate transporter permease n=1 Tax=Martelella mediterranea TaxID=293089 RepID=UPI001E416509|nr:tripartite tricarboxylate transporter permease [Martelella mediterranea]MCD1636452.1 tripartite tricarboxylate transporter permease [Martelella mediterranea]
MTEVFGLFAGLAGGTATVLSLSILPYLLIGVFLGVTVGAIPGLTGSMLIALSLPATFFLTPEQAMALLVAEYVGSVSGGLISATLLSMPGTPASVMTTLDGYPMAAGGQPGRALGLGTMASLAGGLMSWLFLVLLAMPLASVAVQFGPWEYFSMALLALLLISAVRDGSMAKALLSGLLGVLLALPGEDPSIGMPRLTFGMPSMEAGFSMLPVLVGVYAISQVVGDLLSDTRAVDSSGPVRTITVRIADVVRHRVNLARSAVIGTMVGILPGVGANIGSVMSYLVAKKSSRTPEEFGHGSEEGIVASEAGNNATVGGALIPLISLGIPGSIADAFLMSAMVIHGITPGPLLFTTNAELVYVIMGAALFANLVMFAVMLSTIRFLRRLTDIPLSLLFPPILVFCVVGSFALNNRMFDVWVMIGCGALGVLMNKARIPLAPFVIGFVLAPIAEAKLRTGLMISGGDYTAVFERPIALGLLALSALLLFMPAIKWMLRRRTA